MSYPRNSADHVSKQPRNTLDALLTHDPAFSIIHQADSELSPNYADPTSSMNDLDGRRNKRFSEDCSIPVRSHDMEAI